MRLLDLFCGAGGAAMGYHRAGFDKIVGVDNVHQPRYPFEFVQADALEYLAEHGHDYEAIHASPPCQGYSIMHNLPWLRGRDYPLLLLPTLEMLEALGKPYVVENVMGARHGSKTLKKRGLEAHGLKAGWLCGGMFGLPFYRHRLFATNWLWLAPGHPRHIQRIRAGRELKDRASKIVTIPTRSGNFNPNYRKENARHIGLPTLVEQPPSGGGLKLREGYEHVEFAMPTLANWQNGADGIGIGHAKGWRLAAEAMGIDWMKRDELTQAVPPAFTEFIGRQMLLVL